MSAPTPPSVSAPSGALDDAARPSLIIYPSDFPIKIMGPAEASFAATIADVVRQFDPDFDATRLEQRPSAKGNFIALTATVRATSRTQLDDLYRALSSHPMVKVVL